MWGFPLDCSGGQIVVEGRLAGGRDTPTDDGRLLGGMVGIAVRVGLHGGGAFQRSIEVGDEMPAVLGDADAGHPEIQTGLVI